MVFITTSLIACVAGAGYFRAKKKISRTRVFPSRGLEKVSCACYAVYAVYAGYYTDISGHCFFFYSPARKRPQITNRTTNKAAKKWKKKKRKMEV